MIKAPLVDHLINCLYDGKHAVDDETLEIIDSIFDLSHNIRPIKDTDYKELWIKARRGKIEDYGDYYDYLQDGSVNNYEEFEQMWKEDYPDEVSWYVLRIGEYRDDRVVSLGRSIIYNSENQQFGNYGIDLTDLFKWIRVEVIRCLFELKDGQYNTDVANNLPYQHRTGTIARKDYWKLFPDYRADYFSDITNDEIQEFVENVARQEEVRCPIGEMLPEMCARQFYEFCAIGYQANEYDRLDGLTPKQQYYRKADGRDEGLSEIDENDPAAFAEWFNNRERHGGHPWEVCAGGNSTHIDLYVCHEYGAYSLTVRGKSYSRSIETIKFYNALRRTGVAVYLCDAQELVDRVTERDVIGIVPCEVYPVYCESLFPNMDILDFMNLPYEREDVAKMLPYITWFPEKEVQLVSDGELTA